MVMISMLVIMRMLSLDKIMHMPDSCVGMAVYDSDRNTCDQKGTERQKQNAPRQTRRFHHKPSHNRE